MRLKLGLGLVGAVALGVTGCGHSEAPAGQASGNSAPGCVWVVESPTTKLYLCGTIHLLRDTDYPLPASYDQAYADSQRLLLELPPGSSQGSDLSTRMAKAGSIGDGRSLYDLITPETAKAFKEWAAKRKMNPDLLSSFRPWFAALMIAATEYQAAGANASRGVDVFYEAKAAKDGKPGEGLESVQQQIDLFAKLTDQQQAELLEQTLGEVSQLSGQFEDMVTAWKKGDLDELNKMLFEEAEKYPVLLDLFLHQRNASWIPKLESLLGGKEHVMVLVGSGHLGGKKGVVELLRSRGYKVAALKPSLNR